jgi:hypothetical protein
LHLWKYIMVAAGGGLAQNPTRIGEEADNDKMLYLYI